MVSILTLLRHTPVMTRTVFTVAMLSIAALPLLAVNGSREPDIVERTGTDAVVGRSSGVLLETPDLSYREYGLHEEVVLNHEVMVDTGGGADSRIAQSRGERGRGSRSEGSSGAESASGSGDDGLEASVNVGTSGGAPLLLTVSVEIEDSDDDADGVSQVFVRTERGSFAMDAPEGGEFAFQVSPFRDAGVHDLEVLLLDSERRVLAEEHFEVAFADFRYGRDNFSFAPGEETGDARVVPYSPVLRNWLNERFDVDEPGAILETLLLAETYDIFSRTVGRAYAFSGSMERYFRFPDELPSGYERVHEIPESDSSHQARMNRLQNDILAAHFVFGDRDAEGEQSGEELGEEVEEIRRRIDRGTPATISYLTTDRHHAMLVYGYIRREGSESIDLIASGNQAGGNAHNLENESAETVRIDPESGTASWLHAPDSEEEEARQLFVVDVRARADDYDFGEADLERFSERRSDKLREAGRAVLVVEMAAGAALVNADGRRLGRLENRNYAEFDGAQVERSGGTLRFTFDPEMDLELRLEGRDVEEAAQGEGDSSGDVYDALVYSFTPADADGDSRAVVARNVRLPADEQRVFTVSDGLVEFED
ncbi:MAG: hypothetical protein ACLFS5_13560 [Spirochaetaceae bacterium]